MKKAFENLSSQREIFQEDISNTTNEMFERHEIELKAKFTVTVPNILRRFHSHKTTTVNTETTSPDIFRSLLRN